MNKPTHKKRHCDAPTFSAIPQKGSGSRLAEARDDGIGETENSEAASVITVSSYYGHSNAGYENWIHHNTVNACGYGVTLQLGSHFQLIQDNEFTGLDSGSAVLIDHPIQALYRADDSGNAWEKFGANYTVLEDNVDDAQSGIDVRQPQSSINIRFLSSKSVGDPKTNGGSPVIKSIPSPILIPATGNGLGTISSTPSFLPPGSAQN